MKQLFKPQLKMEQFIFKLELSSAEQEGRKGGCTGTPGATQGRCHRPLEPHCSKKEGKGTEQRLPTAPQRGAGCFLPIPQLLLTGTQHSSPPLTPQPRCCHTKDEDLGCTPWEGLALAPQLESAPPHPTGGMFWVASASLGSFPSNQGLLFFQPAACHHKHPPKTSSGKPTQGTQPWLPQRGDHQPVSCARSRENPRQQEAAGRGLGREGGRAATTTKTHPLFS